MCSRLMPVAALMPDLILARVIMILIARETNLTTEIPDARSAPVYFMAGVVITRFSARTPLLEMS
jgi:hypothetical protein